MDTRSLGRHDWRRSHAARVSPPGFEFLCIAERGGSLAYLAMPGARTPATVFVATEVTPTSVTFENPSHDYPQLIRYALTPDGGLETTIAGANGARTMKVTLTRVAR